MPAVNPIIIVHGVQGSWLKDEYPVNYQHAIPWTGILHKDFNALHLHPADADVDADPARLIHPHQAVPLIYEDLVEEIREELADVHPFVYAFTYDWRKDNRLAATQLGAFVDRVLRIARVHRRARRLTAPTRVTLIGHSMGGLVIKWYVQRILKAAATKRIDRIITIATPYRGSLKSVEALLPGARSLFGVENRKAMRHAARTMPGLYQLLPTWRQAIVNADTLAPIDIFHPATWQRNLVETLRTRFHPRYFEAMLADARTFTNTAKRPWPVTLRDRVYTAYGVGTDTWWQVPVDTRRDNFFDFNNVRLGPETGQDAAGDGTVHVASSVRREIPERRRRRDERTLRDLVVGHHANMPNHDAVQDWILGILRANRHAGDSFVSPM